MALPSGVAGVFDPVNITGELFCKTDKATPLFNMLGGYAVGAREFVTGADYELGTRSQPAISETASLTAPTPEFTTRSQHKNVTQMFMKAVEISYRKLSNGQALTGLHLEGGTNNVPSEKAFQIANRLADIRGQIEYTILNGTYNLATTPDEADQTRGINAAISTNIIAGGGDELNANHLMAVARALKTNSRMGVDGVIGICNAEQMVQLNKLITDEGQRRSMTAAGGSILEYYTPFGVLRFMEGGHIDQVNGVVTFANLAVCRNVLQNVPEMGNFFYEPLSKTGAAEHGQIFGQWGLDHGPEWFHAKITGLAEATSATTAPKVFVTNNADAPVYTSAVS